MNLRYAYQIVFRMVKASFRASGTFREKSLDLGFAPVVFGGGFASFGASLVVVFEQRGEITTH